MGSQFVDLNADGHTDYLTATFDGSPHIAWGSAKGFGTPERLTDVNGKRLLISSIWNYESRKHENIGKDGVKERCISALAFDWDGDKDLDLLLGSYENGRLYVQMNEGSATEPKFTGVNIPVMAGDQPFGLSAKMTAPQLIDWDGDGDQDLIAGTFGDSYGTATGGGIYLSRNEGKPGAPAFGPLEELIAPSPKGQHRPTRPDAGIYAHVVDYDGDGDLDIVAGGYSMWTPKARELTDAEQATVKDLQAKEAAVRQEQRAVYDEINTAVLAKAEGLDKKSPEYRKLRKAEFAKHAKRNGELRKRLQAILKELNALVPTKQRETFVWFYERQ